MVVAACHKDYLKERTWIEIREDPQVNYGFVGDDFRRTGWGQKSDKLCGNLTAREHSAPVQRATASFGAIYFYVTVRIGLSLAASCFLEPRRGPTFMSH
jgi:hypothetical protein